MNLSELINFYSPWIISGGNKLLNSLKFEMLEVKFEDDPLAYESGSNLVFK